ncbi:MAG: PKD domain-containing protein, partial [Bacteroidetes bacterium]
MYDVRLIVASADGCRDTVFRDDLIQVEGIVPRLAASDTVSCVPFTVTLTDQSIATAPIISRTWTLPDGTVLSGNSPTITHTFSQALQSPENQHLGLPVVLSLSDSSGCSNSDTLTLYLFAPIPAYTADTLHQCNGDTLLLRAAAGDSVGAGNLTFAWWANGLTPDTLTGRTATLFVPWGTPWILSLSVSDSLG